MKLDSSRDYWVFADLSDLFRPININIWSNSYPMNGFPWISSALFIRSDSLLRQKYLKSISKPNKQQKHFK